MPKNFWDNKPVLITGASGFIGKHLAKHLSTIGANVIGLSRRDCDVTDRPSLEHVFKQNRFSVCFHLAADALVEEGETKPYETLKNNILSALNVLELGRLYGTKRLIIASTVHVYGNNKTSHSEYDPPKPSRPYETSKTCVDVIAQSYADTFNLPVLIPRFVNIYGPGDVHFNRIIPKTIRSVMANKSPTMWGGAAIREYLYIDDAVGAYQRLAEIDDSQIERNRIFNFCATKKISVTELMSLIVKLSGKKLIIKKIPDEREHEIIEQDIRWDKAKRILAWQPKISLEEGLKRTIDWYRRVR